MWVESFGEQNAEWRAESDVGEILKIRSCIICIFNQILLRWSHQHEIENEMAR
jgi:hypothetical protein